MRLGRFAIQHHRRRSWWQGFRISWYHDWIRTTFLEVYFQWGGGRSNG